MSTRMQQRRGTAATWTSSNPILAAGEIGFEIDTNKFKIGDGSNRWENLTYFTADAASAIQDLIDGAPGVLDTLNELAAALGDDPAFFTTVATNLSNHEADGINVHGIADTSLLATKSYADQAEADAIATASADATTKANAAQAAAEATAAADATTKANAAQVAAAADATTKANAAQAAAAADATTKANAAQAAAAEDATTKANAALASANSYTDSAVADLVNSAPGALDTLNELAEALGNDADYASTVTNALALKAPLASPEFSGIPTAPTADLGTNTTQVATTAFVDAAIEALAGRNLVLDGGGV